MHKALHRWIETVAVSKDDQLNQMKRQLAGQNGQHKAKERKLTDRVMDESAQKQIALEHAAKADAETERARARAVEAEQRLYAHTQASHQAARTEETATTEPATTETATAKTESADAATSAAFE